MGDFAVKIDSMDRAILRDVRGVEGGAAGIRGSRQPFVRSQFVQGGSEGAAVEGEVPSWNIHTKEVGPPVEVLVKVTGSPA